MIKAFSYYNPDTEIRISDSECTKCKRENCYWSGHSIVRGWKCKNRMKERRSNGQQNNS